MLLLSSPNFFSKLTFSKNSFRNTIRVSNSLDQDQDRHFVGPDLGPNCLQQILLLSHHGILGIIICNLKLKSSAEILGENNARPFLKSVQNHKLLTNNIPINMPDYF